MNGQKLHIGSGPIHLPAPWINIDIANPAADLILDACKLDRHFNAGCASFVFSCHCFEHLEPDDEAPEFLSQCFRAMEGGGVIRLLVPDLKLVCQKYLRGENLRDILMDAAKRYVGNHDTAAARFTYWARAFDHLQIYDFKLLNAMLTTAGFTNIRQMPFGQSDHPELRGLDRFEVESLCVEAVKP